MTDIGDFRVHLIDDWTVDGTKLALIRFYGRERSAILTADGTWHMYDHDGTSPDVELPVFPRGALEAIAEAVKPGPAKAELARLEDALRVERERVDRTLERLTPFG